MNVWFYDTKGADVITKITAESQALFGGKCSSNSNLLTIIEKEK